MTRKGPRPSRRRHQGAEGRVRAPKRKHVERQFGRCDACKFPTRSDGHQGHHSDCPTVVAASADLLADATVVAEQIDLTMAALGHCDDYIDDPAAPEPLRKFLAFARAPAHGALLPKPHPTLYADHEGERVRVTMASQMGDVGITTDLSAEFGYQKRVIVKQLSNFSERP